MKEIQENVSLSSLTTFGIGGDARYFVDVESESELKEAIGWAKSKDKKFVILSGGSNVLVPDGGTDALVIRIVGDTYELEGNAVTFWSGTNLLHAIKDLGKQGFGGWEKLAGIPGSVGGAVRGNAGAFGSEIKDFVINVEALHTDSGEIRKFNNEKCDFSYRHSFFKDYPEWIITSVAVRLSQCDVVESRRLAEETIAEREKRHLQNVKAAGSYFMNPVAPDEVVRQFEEEKGVKSKEGRVPAGWLIEKAGMKGVRVGGAVASEQHPNYIVNNGNATAADVQELSEGVISAVKRMFNIDLQLEVTKLT